MNNDAKTHRIIYSLQFEIEPPEGSGPGVSCQLIVPLDRQGHSLNGSRPRPPKSRVIDLREGDYLMFDKQWRKVLGVKAYRDAWCAADGAAEDDRIVGYLYRPAATIEP